MEIQKRKKKEKQGIDYHYLNFDLEKQKKYQFSSF